MLLVWSHYNKKVYGCDHELVDWYEISISQTTMDIFPISVDFFSFTYPWQDFYRIWLSSIVGIYLIRNRTCLPFSSTWVQPWYFGGIKVAYFWSYLCCVFCFVSHALFLPVSLDWPFLSWIGHSWVPFSFLRRLFFY